MSLQIVSIAGAILWGVLLDQAVEAVGYWSGFNRRGDSLGGAALLLITLEG